MGEILEFVDRGAFRDWLIAHCQSEEGQWLLFGKAGGPKTLTGGEALEEALCFGWIDGQMERLDETSYKKYFSKRRANSKWSEKNKGLVEALEQRGLMTDAGRAQIQAAKANGQWAAPVAPTVTEDAVAAVAALLVGQEPAHTNFLGMSPSVRRTYTRAYLDAKTDAGREKRLQWMVERLEKNLKPM